VLLVEADQRLPLKSHSDQFHFEIQRKLKKSETVILEEDLNAGAERVFENLFFGLRQTPPPPPLKIWSSEARKPAIVYWRVFINPQDCMLLLRGLAQFTSRYGLKCFFIIYPSMQFHVRLRFVFSSTAQAKQNETRIIEWLKHAMDESFVKSFRRSRYEPELDRWPGERGVENFESASIFDSEWALRQIQMQAIGSGLEGEAETLVSMAWLWLDHLYPDNKDKKQMITDRLKQLTRQAKRIRQRTPAFANAIAEVRLDSSILKEQRAPRRFPAFLKKAPMAERFYWASNFIHLGIARRTTLANPSIEIAVYQRVLKALLSQSE
jgi:thiopeptide-type bacteriocin biosynthesis protein